MSIPRNLGLFADSVSSAGKLNVAGINATGTPSSSTVLLGDGTWGTLTTGTTFLVKTTSYTALASDNILANTSGGSFTITLPASPTTGSTVYIQDAGYFDIYPLTIGRNSSTIMGTAEDMVVSVKNVGFGFVYSGSDWRIF